MTKIFIDTNLFLGLYWSDEDTGQIFGDIEALKPYLLFPDLVFDEFLRNRDRILDTHSRQIKKTEIGEISPRSSSESSQISPGSSGSERSMILHSSHSSRISRG